MAIAGCYGQLDKFYPARNSPGGGGWCPNGSPPNLLPIAAPLLFADLEHCIRGVGLHPQNRFPRNDRFAPTAKSHVRAA